MVLRRPRRSSAERAALEVGQQVEDTDFGVLPVAVAESAEQRHQAQRKMVAFVQLRLQLRRRFFPLLRVGRRPSPPGLGRGSARRRPFRPGPVSLPGRSRLRWRGGGSLRLRPTDGHWGFLPCCYDSPRSSCSAKTDNPQIKESPSQPRTPY